MTDALQGIWVYRGTIIARAVSQKSGRYFHLKLHYTNKMSGLSGVGKYKPL